MSGINLTNTEWRVLDCLWEASPRSSMQIAAELRRRVGWAKTTTMTMLRRMTDKGLLRCEEIGAGKSYSPLVAREDAVKVETENFIERVYKGSVSLMISEIASNQELSREEIAELYEILRRAEEGTK
ncbi:MAG: BlaI/MecI/CopY family transcriptional regulator [Bacillota bacterium]|nr:BlaI/MecI/CopY family transcriptional regulator [Bacillota bacterium]